MADERYDLSYPGETVERLLSIIADIVIPERLSQLINDTGFITSSSVPTKTSDLTNDSGFITGAAVPTKVSQLTNDTGYSTAADLSAEEARAMAAESLLASIASLTEETDRATGAEGALQSAIEDILAKIPNQATDQNQLADKAFVNSSINSNTANLVTNNGVPFTSLAQLQQVTASNNDYAYVVTTVEGGTYYDRYKYNGSTWELEYRVNSTVFTAAQWNAINSNITAALVEKLENLPDEAVAITTSEINEICV